ncbi:Hypothetical_protein [Hexamita inflata]|uniref:Hypothetical_protein n=1 Tax=Hexamita inflata TaxID=28002 RepID=A0AA86P256_9EUKA|nr:Hypothetical protein HINF_LOCUS17848 [Hexamita inflata]CAI9940560.1 Hypothetical protein HINF_LOCUS28205 [Hexamita inflata]
MWLDLIANTQTICQISSNQSYTLILASKNKTQTIITQFLYQLNSTTSLVNTSFIVRSEILLMINNSLSTSLQIKLDTDSIDNIPLLKVVNHNLEAFKIRQIIVLVVSMVVSLLLTIIFYDAKYYCNRSAKQTTKMSKIILLKFNEFDDIE